MSTSAVPSCVAAVTARGPMSWGSIYFSRMVPPHKPGGGIFFQEKRAQKNWVFLKNTQFFHVRFIRWPMVLPPD